MPLIFSPRQGSQSTTYHVVWLWTLRKIGNFTITMTNTSKQITSYGTDTMLQEDSSCFCFLTSCAQWKASITRWLPRRKTMDMKVESFKQFTLNYTAATKALQPGIWARKHYFKGSRMTRRLMLEPPIIGLLRNSLQYPEQGGFPQSLFWIVSCQGYTH